MKPFSMPPPHPKERRIIFGNLCKPGYTPGLESFLAHGGYKALGKALAMKPADIVAEVKASNLRGRGGAGFPCGTKWAFIKHDDGKPHYFVVNGDESEPGTFKDRHILHHDPHQLLEGLVISAFATNCHLSYIYIRCEFPHAARVVERAIAEARAAGYVGKNILGSGFDCDIHVHQGAGAYICGEETSLLESLEGKRPYPRIKPPYFPAVLGLYMQPTVVNNVETVCHVRHIIERGGREYAAMGTPGDGGTRMMCVSGDVVRPGFYEFPVGAVTLGELIFDVCGGLKPGRKLKAVIPGGSSAKVLRAGETFFLPSKGPDGSVTQRETALLDLPMDSAGMAAAGTMIGSGGVMVMAEPILRPRILRAVHPVPRGKPLDVKNHNPHARWPGPPGRPGHPPNRRRQYRRTHDLRLRRSLRMAHTKLPEEISRGIFRVCRQRPSRQKPLIPPRRAGRQAGRTRGLRVSADPF